jgi:hypothetical protein
MYSLIVSSHGDIRPLEAKVSFAAGAKAQVQGRHSEQVEPGRCDQTTDDNNGDWAYNLMTWDVTEENKGQERQTGG